MTDSNNPICRQQYGEHIMALVDQKKLPSNLSTLRIFRLLSGLKQFDAANKAGLHYSALCKAELGYGQLSDKQLSKLAEIYGVEASCLAQPNELFQTPNQKK
jgi:transcriptional regulator with XRE-family HTH domain